MMKQGRYVTSLLLLLLLALNLVVGEEMEFSDFVEYDLPNDFSFSTFTNSGPTVQTRPGLFTSSCVPDTIFTIMPGETGTFSISMIPEKIFTPSVSSDGSLQFTFNKDEYEDYTGEAGVMIMVPPSQLAGVQCYSGGFCNVLSGFSNEGGRRGRGGVSLEAYSSASLFVEGMDVMNTMSVQGYSNAVVSVRNGTAENLDVESYSSAVVAVGGSYAGDASVSGYSSSKVCIGTADSYTVSMYSSAAGYILLPAEGGSVDIDGLYSDGSVSIDGDADVTVGFTTSGSNVFSSSESTCQSFNDATSSSFTAGATCTVSKDLSVPDFPAPPTTMVTMPFDSSKGCGQSTSITIGGGN